MLPTPNQLTADAAPLVEAHNINSTDGALLRAALDLRALLRAAGNELVLVAADQRLLRAADQEGLPTLNPEAGDLAALQALTAAP